ncbi:MAG: IS4 family transposase [Gloeocapsa sp. DLM2.Bin57]|nr:MAG: IS4 family transposase [Gloeocapsa sp. DLM2.Bin57]
MELGQVFERFSQETPVSVMVRGLMEKILSPQKLDQLFENYRQNQYTKELMFSTIVEMMSLVICGIYPSIHSVYQAKSKEINVSVTSIYNKLNATDPILSAQLVRETAQEMEATIRYLQGTLPDSIPGHRIKILDGNTLGATEHRLKPLRSCNSAPLPGQSLVVLDPSLMLAIDVFPCEDGHAQERSLLPDVIKTVEEDDVWIADRNFCTLNFLEEIASRSAFFVIREHKCLPKQTRETFRYIGTVEEGKVFEQTISISDEGGYLSQIRRIKLILSEPTRDGAQEIFILTNLSSNQANPLLVAKLYRKRWTIETLFQILTVTFNCEIKTLGYPKAALLAFCLALVAYNLISVVLAALRAVHGTEIVQKEVSSYYLALEISGTYRGMMIAIPPTQWKFFGQLNFLELTNYLRDLAKKVNLKTFQRHARGPKKIRSKMKRVRPKKKPHVSTNKILTQNMLKKPTP